ncbi:M13 family metallopeptidase [Nitrospirillum pindoramense]|uniref:Endothelin-converting enzyme/putative endopeptidase n=1 Tax=Nitrospirillum amazonense TaxID=28077 RepID=A0A560HHT8_9PROT|nr:M13 family metallopeptidase [Nitrospirillum amazonense]TWB45159.1 endothelin-converting enzyme/putative endopeptidase [Nitrospirillum amazonense]
MSGVRSLSTSAAVAALIAAAGLAGCHTTDTKPPAPPLAAAQPAPDTPAAPGLPVVDNGVSPCDNFFLHACSVWNKRNPIPADQSRWGTFNKLADDNLALLHDELEKLAARSTSANASFEGQRIADFYAACMDEAGIESRGLAPLQPLLARINGLKSKKALSGLLIDLHMAGVNAFHRVGQQQDFKDATQVIAGVYQGGLGLPDKPYYFKDDDKSKQQRAAYVAHIGKMMALAGLPDAEAKAQTVMRIETQLADASLDRTAMREPENRYHLKTFAELQSLDPAINWTAYIHGAGLKPPATLNVSNPDYMKRESKLIRELSLADIKTYLTWRTLSAYATWLPDAFVQENFDFYDRTLRGAREMKPRWKRCVAATDAALGEDLGKYFVARAFGPEKKTRMLQMVADIRKALDETFPTLTWMSPETQAKAHAKLDAFTAKIGYPDKWRDYSALTVSRGDALGNALRAETFEFHYDMAKIGKPVDKGEWSMTPPTVNAYYSSAHNDINFPAGILQPPFFNDAADDATNYGAIGVVIGHEITHGFDDQGRKFDGNGNLKDWWTADDAEKFKARAQCLVDQYGSYVADGDVKENGKLKLGENTADNGGIRVAYRALMERLGARKDEKIGGLTAAQRFFYGFAQVWCGEARPETRRLQAQTDPHSLGEFRVNGTLSNMKEFAEAFNCKPTDKMVAGEKACRVW